MRVDDVAQPIELTDWSLDEALATVLSPEGSSSFRTRSAGTARSIRGLSRDALLADPSRAPSSSWYQTEAAQ